MRCGADLSDDLAISVIVVDGTDFSNLPQRLKGFVVEFVDMGHMGIGDDDVRQCLHIAQSVGKSFARQSD